MIVVEFTDEPNERALFEKMKGKCRLARWEHDPVWGQTGVLWFEKPEELRDALIEATATGAAIAAVVSSAPVAPRTPAEVEVGDEVLAFQGSKSGWGVVVDAARWGPDSFLISFPDAPYPQSMVAPTGDYVVGFKEILGIKKKPK